MIKLVGIAAGLIVMLASALTYLYLYVGGSHRCGVIQLAMMLAGALLALISSQLRSALPAKEIRAVIAGLFFLTALADLLLYYRSGVSVGYLVVLLFAGTAVLLWPRRALPVEKITLLGSSLLLTFALVSLPLEFVLRSDFSKFHLFGVYDHWPVSLEPALNSRGYRDVEHTLDKPPGVIRILILGDSFAHGWAVRDDQVFSRHLAELAGPQVEIINMARNGWNTANQLVALREEGLAYHPDIVVVGAVTNDPEPYPDLEALLALSRWNVCTCIPLDLTTFKFVDYQLNNLGGWLGIRYDYAAWERDLYDPDKPYWPAWQLTVQEFGELLKKRQVPGYVFTLPTPGDYRSTEFEQKYRLLAEEFDRAGFVTTNLWPDYSREFAAVPFKSLWALPNDTHPGPELHQFYARQIWEVLQPEVERLQKAAPPL